MGFDQYHELPEELSAETRTYVRIIQSLPSWQKKLKKP